MDEARTEHELLAMRWDDDDVDACDELHRHFTELQGRGEFKEWPDVADEGSRMWGRMFLEEIATNSPADGVISAVAAAGYALAIAHVARRLGVTEYAIHCAVETGGPPDVDNFLRECRANEPQA